MKEKNNQKRKKRVNDVKEKKNVKIDQKWERGRKY